MIIDFNSDGYLALNMANADIKQSDKHISVWRFLLVSGNFENPLRTALSKLGKLLNAGTDFFPCLAL